jgi:peptidyl-prolyl cis-trans isomerase A (cyclophilin A)
MTGRIDVARIAHAPDDTRPKSIKPSTAGRLLAMHAVRLMRLTSPWVALALAACMLTACGKKPGGSSAKTDGTSSAAQASSSAAIKPTSAPAPKPADPLVVLHTTAGDITIQLFQEKSPRTVENFLRSYAERGYYDQTIFHHVEPGVMVIAGGYTTDLQRKATRAPIYNESRNGLSNRRGTVAMIRDADGPHSATSEFFVNLADNPDLDFRSSADEDLHGYCVFGEVVGGMDVVDRIAHLPTKSEGDFQRVPSPAVTITSVARLR